MVIQGEAYADLVAATQRALGAGRWEDLTQDLTELIVMPHLLKEERVVIEDNSYGTQWNLITEDEDNARHTALYANDETNVSDGIKQARVDLRHTTTSWAWDEREKKMNGTKRQIATQILDLVKTKRFRSMSGLAKLMERTFWSKPVSSADAKTPYGIFYYIVPNTNATGGFIGGNPTGFAGGAANVDSNILDRWKNWAAGYVDVSKFDLVRQMREAATYTYFVSPVPHPTYDKSKDKFGYYSNYNVISIMEEMLEAQNDNLGNDIASKDGEVLFRKRPIQHAHQLDANEFAIDPVIGINWANCELVFAEGEYLNEQKPIRDANSHRVFKVFVDCTWNLRLRNRRKHWICSKAA